MRFPVPGLLALWAFSCSTLKAPADLQARLDAAAPGAEIVLAAGNWSGGVVVRQPVTIRGAGMDATVLTGTQPLVVQSPGVIIESLGFRAGSAAVRVSPQAALTLRHVRLAGAELVLSVEERGTLTSEDVSVECAGGGLAGVFVKGGRWEGKGLTVGGSCRRGVEVVKSDVDLLRVSIQGAREAGLHSLSCSLKVADLTVSGLGAEAPGLFEAQSKSDLRDLSVTGGEEAVLLRGGETRLKGLTVRGSGASAIATVGGTHTVSHVTATGPFQQGALSVLNGSTVTASDITVQSAGASGLLAVKSHIDVDRMTVESARSDRDGDFGHGLIADRSVARFQHVRVTHSDGAAVYTSGDGASTTVEGCEADKVSSGVMAALGARARVQDLHVSNAPMGVVATGASHVHLKDSTLEALVGILTCKGSAVEEECGISIKADAHRRSCEDENLGAAWNQVLSAP